MSSLVPTPSVFTFAETTRPLRIVVINGNPWFVAKDVAEALGYVNHADAITRHCKGVVKRYPLVTDGGTQEVRVISEPDMYRLVVGSTLPSAQRFEAWVFEEVLPSIRNQVSLLYSLRPSTTGGYSMTTITFDTLAYVKTLREAGVSEPQAEAQASALATVLKSGTNELATKGDIRELALATKNDIELVRRNVTVTISDLKAELFKWVIGLFLAQAGLFAALVKILH